MSVAISRVFLLAGLFLLIGARPALPAEGNPQQQALDGLQQLCNHIDDEGGRSLKSSWTTAEEFAELQFESPVLKGGFIARDQRRGFRGSGHGFRGLVFKPTGKDLHPAEGKIGGKRRHRGIMNLYRVYSKSETFGSLRDDPAQVRQFSKGAELIWPANNKRPVQIKARWQITGSGQIDLSVQAVPRKALEKFEILLANYVALDMTKGVHLSGPDGPVLSMVRPSEAFGDPGNYPFFPLTAAARQNQLESGRIHSSWQWKSVVPKSNAALPIAFAEDGKTQIVLMGDPESTSAVCVTPTPTEGTPADWGEVEQHSSLYLSLFCRDVAKGETCTARAKFVVIEQPRDSARTHRLLYERFMESIASDPR